MASCWELGWPWSGWGWCRERVEGRTGTLPCCRSIPFECGSLAAMPVGSPETIKTILIRWEREQNTSHSFVHTSANPTWLPSGLRMLKLTIGPCFSIFCNCCLQWYNTTTGDPLACLNDVIFVMTYCVKVEVYLETYCIRIPKLNRTFSCFHPFN